MGSFQRSWPLSASCPRRSVSCVQCIPVPSFQRESPNDVTPPWPVAADIWYSERVAGVKDDVPKWCA